MTELDKGQLKYKDLDGHTMILPMQDKEIREAFIRRLMDEFSDRDVEELLDRFKQASEDASKDRTKSLDELGEVEER